MTPCSRCVCRVTSSRRGPAWCRRWPPTLAADLVGPVDLLTVVRGSIFSTAATAPDGHVPPGFNLDLAAMVRARVRGVHGDRIPVFVQGSMVDVAQAEWAVGEGDRATGSR